MPPVKVRFEEISVVGYQKIIKPTTYFIFNTLTVIT
jgi:hypothetical protein